MARIAVLLGLLSMLSPVGAVSLGLVEPLDAWNIQVGGACTITRDATVENALSLRLTLDGDNEDFPYIWRGWPTPRDWRAFCRLKLRFRIRSDTAGVTWKRLRFVVYDADTCWVNRDDQPSMQQFLALLVQTDRWYDLDLSLLGIRRGAVTAIAFYCLELPPGQAQALTWDIERVDLVGPEPDQRVFDAMILPAAPAAEGVPVPTALAWDTGVGLRLDFADDGDLCAVGTGVNTYTPRPGRHAGLLLRDAAGEHPAATPANGTVERVTEGVRQRSERQDLGLSLEALYRQRDGYIEVAGSVTSLTPGDRALTVVLALPCPTEATWEGSVDGWPAPRSAAPPGFECSDMDAGLLYGEHGGMSRLPIGSVTVPDAAAGFGLTLGVRMDEPQVHRTVFNAAAGLVFVAVDLAIAAEDEDRSVPFRFLLYAHDPRIGLRGALARYYAFFPEFFTPRAHTEGGWHVWGNLSAHPEEREAGLAIDWGPYQPEQAIWDNAHDALALVYIEPGAYQQTMGDMASCPTQERVIERVRRSAAGDAAELAQWEETYYARIGGGHLVIKEAMAVWEASRPRRDYLVGMTAAVAASAQFGPTGEPYCYTATYPWIGDNGFAGIVHCNLNPAIPGGKGRFNLDAVLPTSLAGYASKGARMDGIGLDCLDMGQDAANYRREHFALSAYPLTFSREERVPVMAGFVSTVEWLQELARVSRERGHVVMANGAHCDAAYLTFAAPYLDILGCEGWTLQFPGFARAIMGRKMLTDLPTIPRPAWEVDWHTLYGIYPGWGNRVEDLTRVKPILARLAAAGWNPSPALRTKNAAIQIERFGGEGGAPSLWVLHNRSAAVITGELLQRAGPTGAPGRLDTAWSGAECALQSPTSAKAMPRVSLAPHGTLVLTAAE